MARNKKWLSVLARFVPALMLFVCFLYDQPAAAATITDYDFGTGFSCNAGTASGQLFTGATCDGDPASGQIFSSFICEFEKVIQEVLGQVYCKLVYEVKDTVLAAMTLAVAIFGAAFLMGVSPFTAKELMLFAAKFTLVMAFALNAEYMIGIGYRLFMGLSKEGILIVLEHLFEGSVEGCSSGFSSGEDIYKTFDCMLTEVFQMTAKEETADSAEACGNAIFALTTLMMAVMPPVFFIAIYFMIKLVWIILRAVFGYCQGILAVTFLITLAPIYVSFALFKPTRTLFDKWVQYLISFSFQMVIVFAFIGIIFTVASKTTEDLKGYTDLVKPYDNTFQSSGMAFPWKVCGICEVDKSASPPACKGGGKVLHPSELVKDEDFLNLVTVKVIAMIVLFYVLDIMMDFVPQMARYLAGPKYAGQIGGGSTGGMAEVDVSMPGEALRESFTSGFIDGFQKSVHTPGAIVSGFMAGGERLVLGSAPNANGEKLYEGLIDRAAPIVGFGALVTGAGFARRGAEPTYERRAAPVVENDAGIGEADSSPSSPATTTATASTTLTAQERSMYAQMVEQERNPNLIMGIMQQIHDEIHDMDDEVSYQEVAAAVQRVRGTIADTAEFMRAIQFVAQHIAHERPKLAAHLRAAANG